MMSMSYYSQTIVAGKRQFSFREAGDGCPLVLLHGIGSNSGSWQRQLTGLSDKFRVIAWDAPGYGASTALDVPKPYAQNYADALAMFLDAMQISECRLVGHSLGTLMAVAFAKKHVRTTALVLASCALGYQMQPDDPLPKKIQERLRNLERLGPEGVAQARAASLLSNSATPDQVVQVREAMAQIRPEGYQQATMMLAQGDLEADALQVKTPCLVLCGSDDQITPETHSQQIAEVLDGARYQSLTGAGHVCYIEQPEMFNNTLRIFFTTEKQ
jgi:pimeloyl-ACP methyl ester carboxylesterase